MRFATKMMLRIVGELSVETRKTLGGWVRQNINIVLYGWVVKVDPLASGSIYSPSPTCWPRTPTCWSADQPVGQHLIISGWVITVPIWCKYSPPREEVRGTAAGAAYSRRTDTTVTLFRTYPSVTEDNAATKHFVELQSSHCTGR